MNSLLSATPLKWKQYVRESELWCHTSPVDGEITLKFGSGYKNVLSVLCKDYCKEFVRIRYERPLWWKSEYVNPYIPTQSPEED